jgi:hypothetical protein
MAVNIHFRTSDYVPSPFLIYKVHESCLDTLQEKRSQLVPSDKEAGWGSPRTGLEALEKRERERPLVPA